MNASFLALALIASIGAPMAARADFFTSNATLEWNDIVKNVIAVDDSVHDIKLNTVNYTKVAESPYKEKLDAFAAAMAAVSAEEIDSLKADKDKFYAFFINAYNALAVKTIVENPCESDLFGECAPIESIRDIAYGFWPFSFGVWTRTAGQIGGKDWSLDDIEMHLRQPPSPLQEDSRLHAAIVCASVSCPNLRPSAYTPDGLLIELPSNFNNFLSNDQKGMKIDQDNKKVILTPIFKWFGADFKPSPLEFIIANLDPNHPDYAWLKDNYKSVKVEYFSYDWDVNAVKGTIPCSVSHPRPCFRAWHLVLTIAILLVVVLMVVGAVCISRKCRKRDGYHRV